MPLGPLLYFDLAAELRLRDLWARLAGEGVSDAMASSDLRPHISLAGLPDPEPAGLREALAELARTTPPLTVELSAVGTFPSDEGVVYIAPTVTPPLLALHERLYAELHRLSAQTSALYRPGSWMPHCTVAIRLPAHRVPVAVSACRRSGVFGPARITELGLLQFPPIRELVTYSLEGTDDD